jgi:serine/threonine protein kinase/Flp pilus assembly protein TadD
MLILEKELLHCEQCGAPLESGSSALGCLNCLLLGGFNDVAVANRRYQHYEVCLREDGTLRELGRGAMGVTYRAVDINLDSQVALKVISARFSDNPQAHERFRREARAAAQLRHPNVASVFHFGETATGQCFYAMELIEGETLEARVRRDGPLPAAMALDVAIQVTRALMAAAPHRLVHRDLKPSNIMLVANDYGSTDALVVKVIDFGLAKAIAETPNAQLQTHASFSGTPEFASPEQFKRGEISLDARSDIYSLGATLWYLLCGTAPFAGRVLGKISDHSLPLEQLAAAKVPASLVSLLRLMLATDPDARPQSGRELLVSLRHCREAMEAVPRRRKQLRLAALLIALLTISAVGLTSYFSHRQQTVAASKLPEKSVAVLPFENVGGDMENAFLVDGLQDDVLTSLVKIKDLKVIGRSSVMSYRDASKRNLREIGRQLGVSHVLEASVQRMGERALIHVSLIDTRDNHQVWAERFDRTLGDAITLQGELTAEIAGVLQAKLDPEERSRLEARLTNNPDAYALYLRARAREGRADGRMEDGVAAGQLYEQAIALDPAFALAYARASILNTKFGDPERKTKARAQAEEALRLSPTLGEAHLALATYFYIGEDDPPAALKELAIAETTSPNSGEIFLVRGACYRQQGRWRESITNYQRAQDLDPRNSEIAVLNTRNYFSVRDWPAAASAINHLLELEPNSGYAAMWLSGVQFYSGNLAASTKTVSKLPAGFWPRPFLLWDQSMVERDFATAQKIVDGFPSEKIHEAEEKTYFRACTALARGNVALAQQLFETLRPSFETKVRDLPEDALQRGELGILYAHLGRKEDAIRECRRAVDLVPPSKDPLAAAQLVSMLALVYARTGETDQAVTLIEHLLTTPGSVSISKPLSISSITVMDLRRRWEWDPLRTNPRFQKILAGPEPKTIY